MNKIIVFALLLALAACKPEATPEDDLRGVLRLRLNQRCIDTLPAGPVSTHYNDWDEVVAACAEHSYYVSNTCTDPALCLENLDDYVATN